MKTERRHELKENDLAHMVGSAARYIREQGATLAVVAAGAVIAIAAVAFWRHANTQALDDLWARRASIVSRVDAKETAKGADDLAAYEDLAAETTDASFQMVMLLDRGSLALKLAGGAENPPDATMNNKAATAYEELLQRFGDNPIAAAVARCGLATVEENRFVLDGDQTHKATALAYLKAVSEDPRLNGTPFKSAELDASAPKRIDALEATFTKVVFAPPRPPEVEGEGDTDDATSSEEAASSSADWSSTDPVDSDPGFTATPDEPVEQADPVAEEPSTDPPAEEESPDAPGSSPAPGAEPAADPATD